MSAAWIKASTNVSNRDKVLRVCQYSSVMLLAYYKDSLSKESSNMFQNIRSSASIARRSFRLLKSLNHIANIIDAVALLCSNSSADCKDIGDVFFSMTFEACLAALYYYDNYVFLSRLGVFSHTTQEKDSIYKKSVISWCIGECVKLASLLYKHQSQLKELNILRSERSRVQALTRASRNDIKSNHNKLESDSERSRNRKIENVLCDEISRLEGAEEELTFQYVKAICNVTLSASLIDNRLFVHYLGRRVYDMTTGFLGAATAAIALYENNIK